MLLAYRATPHTSTGIAPATVLFGRDISRKLLSIIERKNEEVTSGMWINMPKTL